jgi:hypothetical protein
MKRNKHDLIHLVGQLIETVDKNEQEIRDKEPKENEDDFDHDDPIMYDDME